jgi:hypothetical protein
MTEVEKSVALGKRKLFPSYVPSATLSSLLIDAPNYGRELADFSTKTFSRAWNASSNPLLYTSVS